MEVRIPRGAIPGKTSFPRAKRGKGDWRIGKDSVERATRTIERLFFGNGIVQ